MELDVDRSGGDPLRIIHDWRGLSLGQCKTLAASTIGTTVGKSWTYKTDGQNCIVIHNVKDARFHHSFAQHSSSPQSGIISGKGCGNGMTCRPLNLLIL